MAMGATFDSGMAQSFLIRDEDSDKATEKALPGAICCAITANGEPVPPRCFGHRSMLPGASPMTPDTVLFMASTTKLTSAVAVMQCVERGQIGLDDHVGKYLPEFEDAIVIEGWQSAQEDGKEEPVLRKATTKMTLRQMLSHTSGISASIFDPVYRKYNEWKGWPQRNPMTPETMAHPVRFDPGTKWIYGFGIDWSAILVTRLNKCTLGEYYQKNIFDPLQMKSSTFRPMRNPSIRDRLSLITVRDEAGALKSESFDIWLKDSEEIEMESGGYGLYSTAEDQIRLLQTFVTDESPILKQETIDEMFRPQLQSPQWLRENAVDAKGIAISGNIMFPESAVNHGLGFIIAAEDLPTGCKSGAAEGGGLTNTYWWIDRKSRVAGLVFLNLLPYMDSEAVKLWIDFQKQVYAAIKTK